MVPQSHPFHLPVAGNDEMCMQLISVTDTNLIKNHYMYIHLPKPPVPSGTKFRTSARETRTWFE
jgi:hypothetical protein